MRKAGRRITLGIATGAVLAGMIWFFGLRGGNEEVPRLAQGSPTPKMEGTGKSAASRGEKRPPEEDRGAKELAKEITRVHAALGISGEFRENPGASRAALESLRRRLLDAPIDTATQAVMDFLKSGRDAATGGDFLVGEGGLLESTPTMRLMMLDALGQIDPLAAADYSRELLPGVGSGAESAVALRNLDWGGRAEDAGLFREFTLRHLSHAGWAAAPDAGYLEGYDAAVRLGDPVVVGILARRIQEDSSGAVANAATLALERLTENADAEFLLSLTAEDRLSPGQRGELLARADIGSPDQRTAVEALLLERGRDEARSVFLKAFPLASHSIGPRLITEEKLPGADERLAADAEALEVVEEWMGDARFESLRGELGKVAERLREY